MLNHTRFLQAIDKFAKLNVLCVGDIMLDRFVYGNVGRLSPEAPVPVLQWENETCMLGGAGNVARNLSALGCMTAFFSVKGHDKPGFEIASHIKALPNVAALLLTDKTRPSTLKTRFVASSQQLLRMDQETTDLIDLQMETKLLHAVTSDMYFYDCVLLSDYQKGLFSPDLLQEIIRCAKKAGKPVIIDPKYRNYSAYAGATLLTPNLAELQSMAEKDLLTDEDIAQLAQYQMRLNELQALLVTRGRDGMTLVCGEETHHIPANAREVADVSGAGDTVAAVCALGVAAGLSLPESAYLANIAAGVVVSKAGTATITQQELKLALHRHAHHGAHKLCSALDAQAQATAWRHEGKRIGFTNGCFDLLHGGHVQLLTEARKTCDKLIVGINSDASVTRLKGEGRPVNDEIQRALMLSALQVTDAVVIFEEDTPLQLIADIRPDILFKGSDYAREDIIGAPEVEAGGGRVVIIPRTEGYSTTKTIERVQNVRLAVSH